MRVSADHLQAIGTMAAALAAMVALFVAWDQGRIMRAQQHASVWPAIQITPGFGGADGRVYSRMSIENSGVGPAVIHAVEVFHDDAPVASQRELAGLMPAGALRSEHDLGGVILAPGKELRFYNFSWPRADVEDMDILEVHNRITVEICYCSVMERCWIRSSGQESPPEEVAACPANAFR